MHAMIYPLFLLVVLATVSATYVYAPRLVFAGGRLLGWHLKRRTQPRRELILERVSVDRKRAVEQQRKSQTSLDDDWEKVDRSRTLEASRSQLNDKTKDWAGVVGFFHPFCNAGGGGERVLWDAIRYTQQRWPNATCVVYTGDHDATKEQILKRVDERFNIQLHAPTVVFLYLTTRDLLLASTWPRFTLLGQSLGSLATAYDAFTLLVPDIFIDTMGYAFALALSKILFPDVPTAAYVHYPTISTDMLGSLDAEVSEGRGVNAGLGKGWRGEAKRKYWHMFAKLYGWVGGNIDVVMTNSSWTQNHIRQLWSASRTRQHRQFPIDVVFPPVAVEELEEKVVVSEESENGRQPELVYIAQFRPEKNHQMVMRAFARLLLEKEHHSVAVKEPRLLLIGSVRDSADETYIYSLRLLAHELHITGCTTFVLNAPWSTILKHLQTSSVGINGMWNEHFGIGVVEYQAAGLISVVNDSGGPKWDIVIDQGDGPTGFHASTEEQFAEGFAKALSLSPQEAFAMRQRARISAKRFNEASFAEKWLAQMERVIGMRVG